MTDELQFEITKEDIRDGRRCGVGGYCPVSLALKRALHAHFVTTGHTKAAVYQGNERYAFELDSATTAFIMNFDRTGEGRPQTVTARRK